MAQAVAEREGLSAYHIIAHGSCGEAYVGAQTLPLETLQADAAHLSKIGKALGADGDLLLWSCDAAQGARGAAFVKGLARLTGANVKAATGLVGSHALGGQWELDVAFGGNNHASAAPLTAQAMASYLGILMVNKVRQKREIAFIDRNVDDLHKLLAGIWPDVEAIEGICLGSSRIPTQHHCTSGHMRWPGKGDPFAQSRAGLTNSEVE